MKKGRDLSVQTEVVRTKSAKRRMERVAKTRRERKEAVGAATTVKVARVAILSTKSSPKGKAKRSSEHS